MATSDITISWHVQKQPWPVAILERHRQTNEQETHAYVQQMRLLPPEGNQFPRIRRLSYQAPKQPKFFMVKRVSSTNMPLLQDRTERCKTDTFTINRILRAVIIHKNPIGNKTKQISASFSQTWPKRQGWLRLITPGKASTCNYDHHYSPRTRVTRIFHTRVEITTHCTHNIYSQRACQWRFEPGGRNTWPRSPPTQSSCARFLSLRRARAGWCAWPWVSASGGSHHLWYLTIISGTCSQGEFAIFRTPILQKKLHTTSPNRSMYQSWTHQFPSRRPGFA